MLILAAVTRERPPEPDGYALLAQAYASAGHLGLTVIAVVFVLLNLWKS
jgi:predicted Zn-dependent protease